MVIELFTGQKSVKMEMIQITELSNVSQFATPYESLYVGMRQKSSRCSRDGPQLYYTVLRIR